MLPADLDAAAAAASSRVLYYLEAAVGYHLVDVGPALEKVKLCGNNPVDPSSSVFALHDFLLKFLKKKKKKTCNNIMVSDLMRETWDLMILSCCVCCCSYGAACKEWRGCWLL